ncbi:MAG: aldo/keto reductase [Anaerolineaceae bacterium]|nr:aldo/keto reductase [Anaerolineaceae bacterium]
MEKRTFGRSGHASTVAIFGGAAFWDISQAKADEVMEQVLAAGVNHIDVAPQYGMAEERIGPWMVRERNRFFLGCKTMERSREGSWRELQQSLHRLKTDHFDLYQIHAVTNMQELDEVTQTGSVLETLVKARQEGLTQYLGITGHGMDSPAVFLEAIKRFDFDSILFPVNFVLYGQPDYREGAETLLAECKKRNIAVMAIKSIAKGPWDDKPKTHTTWYEPFSASDMIEKAVHFVLSQDVTGICTAGDITVLPKVLEACQTYQPMPKSEQEELIRKAAEYDLIFDT